MALRTRDSGGGRLTPIGHQELLSLRKASRVVGRDRAFVGLFVGPERAVLMVGEEFIFTRRQRYQFSHYIGGFHDAILT